MSINWATVVPIWISQFLWACVLVVSLSLIVKKLLANASRDVKNSLRPIMERIEAMSYIAGENLSMNATDLQNIHSAQTVHKHIADTVALDVKAVPEKVAAVVEKVAEMAVVKAVEKVAADKPQP
jgi:ACT domain-containing protein